MCWGKRYQYYTNVSYVTCGKCLAWHGVIKRNPDRFPNHDDGCERSILAVPWKQRKEFREKRRRMRNAAQSELARRKLFETGTAKLAENPDQAIDLFRRAAQIDIYVPELEQLADRCRDVLAQDPRLRENLRKLFAKAFSDKFGWRRYELLPEVMRLQREQHGIQRIRELFQ